MVDFSVIGDEVSSYLYELSMYPMILSSPFFYSQTLSCLPYYIPPRGLWVDKYKRQSNIHISLSVHLGSGVFLFMESRSHIWVSQNLDGNMEGCKRAKEFETDDHSTKGEPRRRQKEDRDAIGCLRKKGASFRRMTLELVTHIPRKIIALRTREKVERKCKETWEELPKDVYWNTYERCEEGDRNAKCTSSIGGPRRQNMEN
jgi:hypothetical protein